MTTFKNVTAVFHSEFYGLNAIFCRELTVEHKPYAQYERAVR